MLFNEMGLSAEILRGIDELGFTTPTPIQEKVIPVLAAEMRDLLGLAQTGTGKTAAFGIPSLQHIDLTSNHSQLLILSPTRELCLQITSDLEALGKYMGGLRIVPVYGGASMDTQIRELRRGAHVVVGTPGRMHDMIRRSKINLENIQILVLDEADEMLKMGFRDDLDVILNQTPVEKNTLLFSATMAPEIATMAKNYLHNPLEFTVGSKNTGTATVDHVFHMVHARDRYIALKHVVDYHPEIYGIVFCRTRMETKDVAARLMRDGYSAEAIHGDLSQAQRDDVMGKFRDKTIRVLVATDVAARGLDVDKLTHVIHYNLPDDIEVYNHRSGRTGRAGSTGTSISIIHTRERNRISMIERVLKRKIEQKPVPTGVQICERQLFAMMERMKNAEVAHADIEPFMDRVMEMLSHLSKEEVIKQFVSLEFNRFLSYYKDARDINVIAKDGGRADSRGDSRDSDRRGSRDEGGSRDRRRGGRDMVEVVVQIPAGKTITKRDVIHMMVDGSGSKSVEVGDISLTKKAVVAQVEKKFIKKIITNLSAGAYKGMSLHAVENFDGSKELFRGGGEREESSFRKPRGRSNRDGDSGGYSGNFAKKKTGFKKSKSSY
ncbi:MAG: DEAD/DEAH box helicase [Schleiferiaceae bacterium]|nr:DEAD/DEAH box helicase [Schleiferiaceae bacterium]